jgi:hypothetical protein
VGYGLEAGEIARNWVEVGLTGTGPHPTVEEAMHDGKLLKNVRKQVKRTREEREEREAEGGTSPKKFCAPGVQRQSEEGSGLPSGHLRITLTGRGGDSLRAGQSRRTNASFPGEARSMGSLDWQT